MRYYNINITKAMRARYLARLWWTKTFGSKKVSRINPDTGEEDPRGILSTSAREAAQMTWAYVWLDKDCNPGYDRDLVNRFIWDSMVSDEDRAARDALEVAEFIDNNA